MAIIFDTELPDQNALENKLLFSFNNNIIKFHSDSPFPVRNCYLQINAIGFNLYPNPSGVFYYNLKEVISILMNANNFKDNFDPIDSNQNYKYQDWSQIVLVSEIYIQINFLNNSDTDYAKKYPTFISGYSQLQNFKNTYPLRNFNKVFVISPSKKLNYWKGYPFDFCIFSLNFKNFKITNTSNNFELLFQENDIVTRLQISDGLFSGDLIVSEITNLEIEDFSNSNLEILQIKKIITNCNDGHYIKWINQFGGWNYWLFKKGRINLQTKGIGELNNDFNNIEDTLSKTENIGVTAREMIYVFEDCNENDMLLFKDLLLSPKIYLFTGKPNTKTTYRDWIEITIKEKTNKIQDVKQNFVKVELEIELPELTTRTL